MSNCIRCTKPLQKEGVCTECVIEFQEGMERARQMWEYSEPRILGYEGTDARTVRREGYNFLLYNLLYCTRRSEYRDGKRVRTMVAESNFQPLAEDITLNRSNINTSNFLRHRYTYLKDAGYITEREDGLVDLGEHDPHVSI